tara:strand:+ start:246 stop:707 length:462 start_codon:yes stop_codon:yes gene_type:complete
MTTEEIDTVEAHEWGRMQAADANEFAQLQAIYRRESRRVRKLFHGAGLSITPSEFAQLYGLIEVLPGPCWCQKDLAELTGLNQASTGQTISNLQSKGIASRRDPGRDAGPFFTALGKSDYLLAKQLLDRSDAALLPPPDPAAGTVARFYEAAE